MKVLNLPILLIGFLIFSNNVRTQNLDEETLKVWWQKDLELDSIPGIGLERTYRELIKDRKGQEVIVAVLDTKVDLLHEDFQGIFWVNEDEIPFNGIDDDNNGYVDDTNGWNFLGNHKNEDLSGQVLASTRIVQRYQKEFENARKEELAKNQLDKFLMFKKADSILKVEKAKIQSYIKGNDSILALYRQARDTIPYFLKIEDYSFKEVDSLRSLHPVLNRQFEVLSLFIQYETTEDMVLEYQEEHRNDLKSLSILNNSRSLLNDNQFDISDSSYGNPILINNELHFQHSTGVTGLIASNRNNNLGISGFGTQIKIMPVVMVADGDENDKDVALAIRYAVDNGADIINMSWGKSFSLNLDWVKESISHANKNDVLLVTSSGNESRNIDKQLSYPTDFYSGEELTSNFINTGGTTNKIESLLVAPFSNYGKSNVDLFAPAQDIYTTNVKSSYRTGRGTSYASPLVAGTAALLKSYFPELTASELKEIILKSATKINLMVKKPGDKENAPLVPFSSLSKTGGILNTYKAFKLAESISETK